jgi:hypothetical protein
MTGRLSMIWSQRIAFRILHLISSTDNARSFIVSVNHIGRPLNW